MAKDRFRVSYTNALNSDGTHGFEVSRLARSTVPIMKWWHGALLALAVIVAIYGILSYAAYKAGKNCNEKPNLMGCP